MIMWNRTYTKSDIEAETWEFAKLCLELLSPELLSHNNEIAVSYQTTRFVIKVDKCHSALEHNCHLNNDDVDVDDDWSALFVFF